MSGLEAALLDTDQEWNLILPVDVPFLTTDFLDRWLYAALHRPRALRLAMVMTNDTPHPTLLIVHRQIAPFITASLEAGTYKLFPALRRAALALAAAAGQKPEEVFWEEQWDEVTHVRPWKGTAAPWRSFERPPLNGRSLDELMNVNTPQEFAEAELIADLLEP